MTVSKRLMDPMADEPNTPKRKRRRWLILAVVLVSLVSWWYWPRGDARFVGRWTLHAVNGQPPKYQEEFTYYRNGLLVHTVAGGTPSVFIWSVRDEHLEFRLQGKTILEAALAPIHRAFAEKILSLIHI